MENKYVNRHMEILALSSIEIESSLVLVDMQMRKFSLSLSWLLFSLLLYFEHESYVRTHIFPYFHEYMSHVFDKLAFHTRTYKFMLF